MSNPVRQVNPEIQAKLLALRQKQQEKKTKDDTPAAQDHIAQHDLSVKDLQRQKPVQIPVASPQKNIPQLKGLKAEPVVNRPPSNGQPKFTAPDSPRFTDIENVIMENTLLKKKLEERLTKMATYDLEGEISGLKNQLTKLRLDNDQKQLLIKQKDEELQSLQEASNQPKDIVIKKLQQELFSLKRTKSSTRQIELEKENEQLKRSLSASHGTLGGSQSKEQTRLQQQIADMREQIETLIKQSSSQQLSNEMKDAEIQRLSFAIEDANTQFEGQMAGQVLDYEQQLQQMQFDLEQKLAESDSKLAENDQQIAKLRGDNGFLIQQTETSKAKAKQLEAELEKQLNENDAVLRQLLAQTEKNERLEQLGHSTASEQQQALNQALEQLKTKDAEYKQLQSQCDAITAQLQSFQSSSEKQVQQFNTDCQTKDRKIVQLIQQSDDQQEQLKAVNAKIAEFQQALSNKELLTNQIKSEATSTVSSIKSESSEKDKQIFILLKTVNEQNEFLSENEAEIQQLNAELQQLRHETAEKIEKLNVKLITDTDSLKAQHKTEVEKLKRTFEEKEQLQIKQQAAVNGHMELLLKEEKLALEQTVKALKEEAVKQMAKQRAAYEQELDQIESQQVQATEIMEQTYQQEMENIQAKHAHDAEAMEKEHQTEMNRMCTMHEQELQKTKSALQQQIKQLDIEHKHKLDNLKAEAEKASVQKNMTQNDQIQQIVEGFKQKEMLLTTQLNQYKHNQEQDVQQLIKQIEQLNQELVSRSNELDDQKIRIQSHWSNKLNDDVTKLKADHEKQIVAINMKYEEQLASLNLSLNSSKVSIANQITKMKEEHNEHTSVLIKNIHQLEARLQTEQNKLQEAETTIQELRTEQLALQQQISEQQQNLTSSQVLENEKESQLLKSQNLTDSLQQKVINLEASLKNVEQSASTEAKSLKKDNNQLQSINKQLLEQLKCLIQKSNQMEEQVAETVQRVQREREDLAEELFRQNQVAAKLRAQLAGGEVQSPKFSGIQLDHNSAELIRKQQAEIEKLSEHRQETDDLVDVLQRKLQELGDRVQSIIHELALRTQDQAALAEVKLLQILLRELNGGALKALKTLHGEKKVREALRK